MISKIPARLGPLSVEEIKRIDALSLSILEKHHLRLIAHCLASFKAMSEGSSIKDFPSEQSRLEWCATQASLEGQEAFISLLLEQFTVAEKYLDQLAKRYDIQPLEITLDQLIAFTTSEGSH